MSFVIVCCYILRIEGTTFEKRGLNIERPVPSVNLGEGRGRVYREMNDETFISLGDSYGPPCFPGNV
jgi:hypothetical protein